MEGMRHATVVVLVAVSGASCSLATSVQRNSEAIETSSSVIGTKASLDMVAALEPRLASVADLRPAMQELGGLREPLQRVAALEPPMSRLASLFDRPPLLVLFVLGGLLA